MKEIKLAVIGLGQRGRSLLKSDILPQCDETMRVVAVCDLHEDRIANVCKFCEEAGMKPIATTNYLDIINNTEVNAVLIATAWESHIDIAVAAMEAGKFVACEVGGAYAVEDCWKLVNAYEQTGTPCMLLENCCFGKRELMVTAMARAGRMGRIVHCSGGYCHDLRGEIANGKENRHYRLRNYLTRNCENYPTHELGPIAKLLDINNGNRLLSLSSFASPAYGVHDYVIDRMGTEHPLSSMEFRQGDIVTTVLKCENGETVVLTLDTTLPRLYGRDFTVRGTKSAYFGMTDMLVEDKIHDEYEYCCEKLFGNASTYEEQFQHPLWKEYVPKGGHDGMDWLVIAAFKEAALTGSKPPIDVYDMATWMSVTAISEASIAAGGAVMSIPDFTRGKWHKRTDINLSLHYNLDRENPLSGIADLD